MSQFTDNEQRFIRAYKRNWSCPRDWARSAMEDGTSSFLDWREWMDSPTFSIRVLEEVLEKHAGREYPPRLREIKEEYNRRTNRQGPAESTHNNCLRCGNSGVLYVVQDKQRGGNKPVIPPARTGHRFDKAEVTTIPCDCDTGYRLSQKKTPSDGIRLYDYHPATLEKLQRVAFSSWLAAMQHAGKLPELPSQARAAGIAQTVNEIADTAGNDDVL